MNLNKVLASSCRRRILRVLDSVGSTNIMDLVRRVNSTYNRVNPNVQLLEKEGIISEHQLGHKRLIKLEREKPKTLLLLKVIRILDNEFVVDKVNFEIKTRQNKQVTIKTPTTIHESPPFQGKTQGKE